MIKLNLTAENDCHQAIKDYLEENVSELLAEKINNGVKIKKDEKSLINKKTLAQFWAYASKKAQEQKTKNAFSASRNPLLYTKDMRIKMRKLCRSEAIHPRVRCKKSRNYTAYPGNP
jgi:hypothetical protein